MWPIYSPASLGKSAVSLHIFKETESAFQMGIRSRANNMGVEECRQPLPSASDDRVLNSLPLGSLILLTSESEVIEGSRFLATNQMCARKQSHCFPGWFYRTQVFHPGLVQTYTSMNSLPLSHWCGLTSSKAKNNTWISKTAEATQSRLQTLD